MSDFSQLADAARKTIAEAGRRCDGCGACSGRCGLLDGAGWTLRGFCAESLEALKQAHDAASLRRGIAGHAKPCRFARTCLGCDRCTARCPQGLSMAALRSAWRTLLRAGGIIADGETTGLMVDCTWDLFSAYRAAQGIAYDDLPLLHVDPVDSTQTGRPGTGTLPRAATLFFPGCTLCTYAPALTRKAFAWLQQSVGACLLATQCCASTLDGIGEAARAAAWRRRVIETAREQGVSRIITVCPGGNLRLQPVAAELAPQMEFTSFARVLADAGVRVRPDALRGCELPVTVVDSCQDRIGAHGPAIRTLFEEVPGVPFPAAGKDAWCCGASGSVNSVNPQFARECTRRQLARGAQAGARTLITACPTCAYTYALERRTGAAQHDTGDPAAGAQAQAACATDAEGPSPGMHAMEVGALNYLEAVFGERIDWDAVFGSLEAMWAGENVLTGSSIS